MPAAGHSKQEKNMRPCIPISKKTGLIIGQDLGSIRNYTRFFRLEQPIPFGQMVYSTLHSGAQELSGLWEPIEYGSGIQWSDGLLSSFPGSSIQLALYLVRQLEAINQGNFDSLIHQLTNYIKNTKAPFYIRIGYEFDLPGNAYDGDQYRLAFRRIVLLFREDEVQNVVFIWHSQGEIAQYDDWFPGREFVDLCGVSVFQQPYRCRWEGFGVCRMEGIESFFRFCQTRDIPLMIAESTPFGGIVVESEGINGAGFSGESWATWFVPVLSLIDRYDVRLWSYIDNDWDFFPMWTDPRNHAPGVSWGDSRVEGEQTTPCPLPRHH